METVQCNGPKRHLSLARRRLLTSQGWSPVPHRVVASVHTDAVDGYVLSRLAGEEYLLLL